MDEFKHLFPTDTSSTEKYKYGGPTPRGEFNTPPRDRAPHSEQLIVEITAAEADAARESEKSPR